MYPKHKTKTKAIQIKMFFVIFILLKVYLCFLFLGDKMQCKTHYYLFLFCHLNLCCVTVLLMILYNHLTKMYYNLYLLL